MGAHADVKAAIDHGREDLVEVLAEHHLLPTAVERPGEAETGLLGRPRAPTIRFERDGSAGAIDRQTTVQVVDVLGLDSTDACEAARDEIRSHPAWDGT